ncbi:MAG: hypothetical protein J5940_06955 [Clostridia bacterium]|nr:hypothetical protein [Clostridia bacterium]
MNKSLYSLILSEDVVSEVDRLAYAANTSRSNMVNRILAEYVSMQTPEAAVRDIFDVIEGTLLRDSGFQRMLGGDFTMNLRTALAYKYNPTVRYSIELYGGGGTLGELRVSFRTQNAALSLCMAQFFKLWQKLERYYCGDGVKSGITDGRFVRELRRPDCPEDGIGDAISEYVRCFDGSLKAFFAALNRGESGDVAAAEAERVYRTMRSVNL